MILIVLVRVLIVAAILAFPLTQIAAPLWNDEPLFPLFRKKRVRPKDTPSSTGIQPGSVEDLERQQKEIADNLKRKWNPKR